MFEPLPTLIRLRRTQRNLSQEALAKLAGVSRRQLALFEDGGNVSLKFLIKVARALEMTDLPVGELRIRAVHQDLVPIVRAADVLARLRQSAHIWAAAAGEIETLSASVDDIIARSMDPGHAGPDIEESAARLANTPPAERHAAGELLRPLGRSEGAADAPRAEASRPARRQRR